MAEEFAYALLNRCLTAFVLWLVLALYVVVS